MIDISKKTYKRNGIQTIVDNKGILWLNENIEKELNHKNVRETTLKYHWEHRKNESELVEEPKKQSNRIFIDQKLADEVITDCRATAAHKFITRLGFKQYVIWTKQQSSLTKIMSSFEGENMQAQCDVLGHRNDLYFHDYKLAMEIYEYEHSNRNIDYEIIRQKAIQLGCKFIRIDSDKEGFSILELLMKYLETSNNRLKKLY